LSVYMGRYGTKGDASLFLTCYAFFASLTFYSVVCVRDRISLCRIRSTLLSEFFTHFDAESRLFSLCERKAYEYPMDQPEKANIEVSSKSNNAANNVVAGIHELAEGLMKSILKETSSQKSSGENKLLAFLLDKLTLLSSGDVISTKDKLYTPSLSTAKLATLHLQQLHNLVASIHELLWKRRKSIDSEHSIKFGLGDVVNHKFFGFRGVIVAWDPRPVVDVSRWDGLQHIKDPQNYPFYHVIPDQNDCIEAFGRERESRYVCEANLEICPLSRRNIDVDLEPEWELDHSSRTYIAPADLRVSLHTPHPFKVWEVSRSTFSLTLPLICSLSMAEI
jgi:hemimethylated DNA binding protein